MFKTCFLSLCLQCPLHFQAVKNQNFYEEEGVEGLLNVLSLLRF